MDIQRANKFNADRFDTRIIRHHSKGKHENGFEYDEVWFGIHEVYYNGDEIVAWTENAITLTFLDPDDLGDVLIHVKDAIGKTVLELETMQGEDEKIKDSHNMLDYYADEEDNDE